MLRVASTVALLLAACNAPPPPAPTRVEASKHLLADPPKAADNPNNPFRRPDKEPPPPRSEPQMPAAELEATLAASAAARTAGDTFEATRLLYACANKIPQSVRCEGELAMLLFPLDAHRYAARYYLEHAVGQDEAAADADFYRRLATTLRKASMWPEAIVAQQRLLARLPEPTAADHLALAELLQGVPSREIEAAAALRRAFELDPGRLEYLRDAGILLGQTAERAEALKILKQYRDAVATTEPDQAEAVGRRISELEAEANAKPAAPATPATKGGKRRPRKPAE